MVFADLFFIYVFIPAFAILYAAAYLIEKKKEKTLLRNSVLVLFSLIFYVWGEPVYILLLLLGVIIDHICGRTHKEIAGIVLHLLLLAVFKYGNLILATVKAAGADVPEVDIRLPIGISFYTFQSISYLADVRAKKCEPQKSFPRLLLYISMFPQLIAGPIVRYTAVASAMDARKTTENDIADGIRRFVYGLGKKVLLADQLGEIVKQTMGAELSSLSTGMAWLGLIAFSLQIYYDFSGYSDMAIGMGKCMGFQFPETFDHPYMCASVTDFWRRWHISLGSFFRDYVYIPLGGNRCSKIKWIRNILIVWALTGFWHGASWNYLLWGLYFGLLLLLEHALYYRKGQGECHGVTALFRRITGLAFVVLGWGIFYFEDFGKMRRFFAVLFGANAVPVSGDYLLKSTLSQNALLLAAALLLCFKFPKTDRRGVTVLRAVWTTAFLVASTILLVGASNHPFLYTRF